MIRQFLFWRQYENVRNPFDKILYKTVIYSKFIQVMFFTCTEFSFKTSVKCSGIHRTSSKWFSRTKCKLIYWCLLENISWSCYFTGKFIYDDWGGSSKRIGFWEWQVSSLLSTTREKAFRFIQKFIFITFCHIFVTYRVTLNRISHALTLPSTHE